MQESRQFSYYGSFLYICPSCRCLLLNTIHVTVTVYYRSTVPGFDLENRMEQLSKEAFRFLLVALENDRMYPLDGDGENFEYRKDDFICNVYFTLSFDECVNCGHRPGWLIPETDLSQLPPNQAKPIHPLLCEGICEPGGSYFDQLMRWASWTHNGYEDHSGNSIVRSEACERLEKMIGRYEKTLDMLQYALDHRKTPIVRQLAECDASLARCLPVHLFCFARLHRRKRLMEYFIGQKWKKENTIREELLVQLKSIRASIRYLQKMAYGAEMKFEFFWYKERFAGMDLIPKSMPETMEQRFQVCCDRHDRLAEPVDELERCPSCDAALRRYARFCSHCGAQIKRQDEST